MEIQKTLLAAIDDLIPPEIIDGADVDYIAEQFVDLDVAFSPVIAERGSEYDHRIPDLTEVQRQPDGRYMLVWPGRHDFESVSEERLKVMRARFLLLSKWYLRNFHTFSHSMQLELAATHLKGMAIPASNSPLAKLLRMAGCSDE